MPATVQGDRRAQVAYFPQAARALLLTGVQCDHCEDMAIANVHDTDGVRFLCRTGYLELLAERRRRARMEALARLGIFEIGPIKELRRANR